MKMIIEAACIILITLSIDIKTHKAYVAVRFMSILICCMPSE